MTQSPCPRGRMCRIGPMNKTRVPTCQFSQARVLLPCRGRRNNVDDIPGVDSTHNAGRFPHLCRSFFAGFIGQVYTWNLKDLAEARLRHYSPSCLVYSALCRPRMFWPQIVVTRDASLGVYLGLWTRIAPACCYYW